MKLDNFKDIYIHIQKIKSEIKTVVFVGLIVLFGQSFILFNVFLQILSNICRNFASEILGKNFVFKCMLNGSSMFRLSEFSIPIPYIFGTTGEAGFLRPPELISKFAGEAGVKKMETR